MGSIKTVLKKVFILVFCRIAMIYGDQTNKRLGKWFETLKNSQEAPVLLEKELAKLSI